MKRKISAPLLAAQAILVAAIGCQIVLWLATPAPARPPNLDQVVSPTIDGWVARDEPLEATPTAVAEVTRVLNFDQAVQRSYTRGAAQFTIYAAYWNRGKMPARAVASHTPDCCWTAAGYRCTAMKFRQALAIPGVRLNPAEWRIFDAPDGGKSYLVFWHTVGGQPFDFGGKFDAVGDPWLTVKALVSDAVLGCREQLFVTVSANVPLETLQGERGFQTAMQRLAAAGLAPAPGGPPTS